MPLNIDMMQQEAMRRVQEMHSRAQNTQRRTAQTRSAPSSTPAPSSPPPAETAPPTNETPPQNIPSVQDTAPIPEIFPAESSKNLLETVFQDKERSLILLLILILANESTKPEALLALMYLVM